jgi:hypothetical protein
MKRHPGKRELLAYAENLVDRRGPISAKIGGHVAGCRECANKVEAMRASLEFAKEAPPLEPSGDFTARLLLAAQNERRMVQRQRAGRSVVFTVVKGVGYAAAIVLVSAVCFGAALGNGPHPAVHQTVAATIAPDPGLTPEAVQRTAAEIETLASAIGPPSKKSSSQWEMEHRRAVHALNADIEAARAALDRNPGCQRASLLVDKNLQRQAQTLRALYAERGL